MTALQLLDLESGGGGAGVGGFHQRRGSGHSLPGRLLKRTNQVMGVLDSLLKITSSG